MSVPEQIPTVSYTANGTTTNFPITFELSDERYLVVTKNMEIPPVGAYTVLNGNVIFGVAPNEGDIITLMRDTVLDRETNYQNYDNSFRPEAVNYDLDKIWHVLQEQNLIDAKLLARLKEEIEWRRTHDANFDELALMRDSQVFSGLKQYVDTYIAATNPNIFGGVTAGIVFAQDQKSVQTHLDILYQELVDARQAIDDEESRATNAEALLQQSILNETTRATGVESSLQTQINVLGVGNKAYLTYADMDADKLNIPAKSKVTVTNDATSSNNGDWQWDGASFTKSVYDPIIQSVNQSKSYTDTQFTELFQRGINIFDKSKVEYSKYYTYLTGEKGNVTAEFVAAGLYIIEGNTEYRVPENYTQQFAFFDSLKNYISGQENAGPTHKFTTPANAKYIGLTVDFSLLDTFMLCKSSEYPASYVPFTVTKSDLRVSSSQVNNLMPDVKNELGFIYINIIDTTKVINGYYVNWLNGQLGDVAGYSALGPYEIKPNTEYQASDFYNQQFAFYDANMTYVGGQENAGPTHKFTTPANAKYIRLSILTTQLNSLVVSETSLFPSSYVPYTAKKIDGLITDDVNTTKIFASAEIGAAGADFTGKNAVQLAIDSINDASFDKRYVITAKGFYKVNSAADVIGYPGYPSMILAKDHVDIIGDGKTVFWCELPYNDAAIGPSANGQTYPRIQYQTLYSYAKDCLIKDVTFIVVNARYALHVDNHLGANSTHKFDGVWFVFKGDKGSKQALGIGTSTGEETYFIGGGSHSDSGQPLYCHNNTKFDKASLMSFNGHQLSSNTSKLIARIESDGSLLHDKMEFIGCSFGGTAYVIEYGELWLKANPAQNYDSFNHAEWQLTGYGNDLFLFDNQVLGYCLRFRTIATGASNTIRFDKNSSAFNVLIKNNQANSDVSLYVDSRDYIDCYIVQDGTAGLSGMAFGCKDLTETAAFADSGVVYTSMGKRLGDCSTVNKSLGVIVNGVTTTITFDKDYTAMSNAQILTEINAGLTGAVADLYIYGRDYYPMMSDVSEVVYNTGASYIAKGSVVAKSGGTVKLASPTDKIFGVALDDIPVQQTTAEGMKKGEGRVLKRGYIYANQSKAHFVLADNQNPVVGTRFSVNNGQLATDANGKISVDIDDGVISINC